jgi:hypothetical protein
MKIPPKHPAILEGRTVFKNSIKTPTVKMLKPGSNNSKLGFIITKGKWKGCPIYSLTLEERKTCPSYCIFWQTCYGSNLYLAHRFDHTHKDFLINLEQNVKALSEKYPNGFVVRLHVLGDFYSVDYVNWWGKMLHSYPQLLIFGYTAYKHGPIYRAIRKYSQRFSERFAIRISGTNWKFSTNRYSERDAPIIKGCQTKTGIVCPQELGMLKTCSECALCFSRKIPKVLFIEH